MNPRISGIVLTLSVLAGCNLFSPTEEPGDQTQDGGRDVGADDTDAPDVPDTSVSDAHVADDGLPDAAIDPCGNGVLDDGEACDGAVVPASCEDLGFGGGEVTCDANCEFTTAACFGCDVYIDDSGDDAADGMSTTTAWATFAPLQARIDAGPSAALTACFRRGAVFETTGPLNIEWAGIRETKLTLRSYGDEAAAAPVLHGGAALTFALVDPDENIWEATAPFDNVAVLMTDEATLTRDGTPPLAESRWDAVQGVVSLHLPDGESPPSGLYASHGYIIAITASTAATRFVDIRELDLRHAGSGVVVAATAADLTNINIDHTKFGSLQGSLNVFSSNGLNLNLITIADNEFFDMDNGVLLSAPDQVNRSIVVERNVFGGVPLGTTFRAGVNVGNHSGAAIRDNTFIGEGTGTAIYLNPFGSGKFMSIERNYISNWGNGISSHMLGTPGDLTVANNIITGCGTGISAGLGGSAGTVLVAHNTVHQAGTGLVTYGGNVVLQNNIFSETTTALRISTLAQLVTSDHNVFSPSSPEFVWGMEMGGLTEWRAEGHDGLSVAADEAGFASLAASGAEDFQLSPSSVAVDAGTMTAIVDDFGRNARTSPPDIGAWELQ